MKQEFYSNGKLLLTGEYLVLDGATALAIPTKFGQTLEIATSEKPGIRWKSIDHLNKIWYRGDFSMEEETLRNDGTIDPITHQLLRILQSAKEMNSKFLTSSIGYEITTKLDFPRDWGLGTSSTLLNNIAQWAQIDAYKLLKASFGGSGYDIAAAQNDTPILYTIEQNDVKVEQVRLPWSFTQQLFFVHLNKKQNSKDGISHYRNTSVSNDELVAISTISKRISLSTTINEFSSLVNEHEAIISSILKIPSVKEELFSDYKNTIKSLGAWGGDFILAIGGEKEREYFRRKGYQTIVSFSEMIK